MKAERHVKAFPPPGQIVISNADDVNVDEVAFRRFCDTWAELFGVSITVGDEGPVADALIFNPGTDEGLRRPRSALPLVGVRFAIGRPATPTDALEWITGRGLDG